jgi:hypothetical protein
MVTLTIFILPFIGLICYFIDTKDDDAETRYSSEDMPSGYF